MRRYCIPVVVIICLLQLTSVSVVAVPEIQVTQYSDIPLEVEELVPHPDFSSPPNITDTGASSQFSSHVEEGSHVNLTWTHNAGAELYYRDEPDDNLPDCYEFIYLSQDLHWPINNYPIEKNLTLNYRVNMNGSFADELLGVRMFNIYVWIIDSSDNWIQLYESYPPYPSAFQMREISISAVEIERIWSGMIEDDNGVQEDPRDAFQYAIGLAPSSTFENNPMGDPWLEYNGSVILSVSEMSLRVLIEQEQDESGVLQPIARGNWTTEYGAECEGLVYDDVGNCYTVGNIRNYQDTVYSIVLTKWDSSADIVWSRLWNGSGYAQGYDIAIQDSAIYVTGMSRNESSPSDFVLTKWDTDGNMILDRYWDGTGSWPLFEPGVLDWLEGVRINDIKYNEITDHFESYDNGLDVEVTSDGQVLTLVRSRFDINIHNTTLNETQSHEANAITLLVFDEEGTVLRTQVIESTGWSFWDEMVGLHLTPDYIYVFSQSNWTKYDAEYNKIWSTWNFGNAIFSEDGSFYKTYSSYSEHYWDISKYRENLSSPYTFSFPEWTEMVTFRIDPIWHPRVYGGPMALGKGDSVLALVAITYDYPDLYVSDEPSYSQFVLFNYNSTGHLLSNHTIHLEGWLNPDWYYFQYEGIIKADNQGRIYIAGTTSGGITLYIFEDPNYTPEPAGEIDYGIILYGASAGIIAIVAIDYIRRRRSYSSIG
ncbi:MAG: hypothetical protein RTU30_08600 [Candidatus Thorarchaeota archaeon]